MSEITQNAVEAEAPVVDQVPEVEVHARTANFMEDSVEIVLENGLRKMVSYENFMDMLAEATRTLSESREMIGFNLPSNVFFFAASSREIQISCYYQSAVKPLIYHGDQIENLNIITPNIIISHKLGSMPNKGDKAWDVKDSRYYCTNKRVGDLPKTFIGSTDRSRGIYLLPMSNTYEDGRMCYGNNQMPRHMADNNLRSLDWYYQYLWETPFNNDLGIKATNSSGVKRWYHELKAAAEAAEPKFPYESLYGFAG